MSAQAHEVWPLEDRRVLRYFLYLAALCQHVTHPYRSGQLISDAGDNDILYLCVLTDGFYLVIELVKRDHHHGMRHVEVVFYLLLRAERVHHVGDRSHKIDRVEHVDRLRAVRHGDGDAVILTYAQDPERLCAQVDLIDHVFVCYVLAHEVERDHKRVLLSGLFDLLVHGSVEVFDGQRQIASALVPRYLYGVRDREYDVAVLV